MARLIAVHVVATAEMLVKFIVVIFAPAHEPYEARNIMHDGPAVNPRIALSPSLFRIRPRSIGVFGLHKAARHIKQVLIVMRTSEVKLILLSFT